MATYSSSLQAVHRPSAPAPYLVSNTIDIVTSGKIVNFARGIE